MSQEIKFMSLTISLATLRERVQRGIDECERFIKKEQSRSADLRPEAAQQHLGFCIAHKKRLEKALENEENLRDFANSCLGIP